MLHVEYRMFFMSEQLSHQCNRHQSLIHFQQNAVTSYYRFALKRGYDPSIREGDGSCKPIIVSIILWGLCGAVLDGDGGWLLSTVLRTLNYKVYFWKLYIVSISSDAFPLSLNSSAAPSIASFSSIELWRYAVAEISWRGLNYLKCECGTYVRTDSYGFMKRQRSKEVTHSSVQYANLLHLLVSAIYFYFFQVHSSLHRFCFQAVKCTVDIFQMTQLLVSSEITFSTLPLMQVLSSSVPSQCEIENILVER